MTGRFPVNKQKLVRNWSAIAALNENPELRLALINTKGEMLKLLSRLVEFFLLWSTPQPKMTSHHLNALLMLANGLDVVLMILNDLGFDQIQTISALSAEGLRCSEPSVGISYESNGVRYLTIVSSHDLFVAVAESEAMELLLDFEKKEEKPVRDYDSHAPTNERSYEPSSFITRRGKS